MIVKNENMKRTLEAEVNGVTAKYSPSVIRVDHDGIWVDLWLNDDDAIQTPVILLTNGGLWKSCEDDKVEIDNNRPALMSKMFAALAAVYEVYATIKEDPC